MAADTNRRNTTPGVAMNVREAFLDDPKNGGFQFLRESREVIWNVKIKVDLDIPDNFARLPQELETAIFRIVQECLTNIHRHSGSRVAAICVSRHGNEVKVEVRDQGKGMPS